MYHLRNSYRLPLLHPFITHYAFHRGAFSPSPPPAASPQVFFKFKLPFCISVWASVDVLHTAAGLPSQIYKCLTSMI